MNQTDTERRRSVPSLLVERGIITERQLADATRAAKERWITPLEHLIGRGLATESDVAAAVGLEIVTLADRQIDDSAVAKLSGYIARRLNVIPIGWRDGELLIATAKPTDLVVQNGLRESTGSNIQIVIATKNDIAEKIRLVYRSEQDTRDDDARPVRASRTAHGLELHGPTDAPSRSSRPRDVRDASTALRVGPDRHVPDAPDRAGGPLQVKQLYRSVGNADAETALRQLNDAGWRIVAISQACGQVALIAERASSTC